MKQKVQGEHGEKDGVGAIHERGAKEHAHGVEVVGHARHHIAGAIALIKAGVEFFEMAEEVVADVELDLARDADEDPALGVEKNAFDEGDGDQEAGEAEDGQMRGVFFLEPVDCPAEHTRKLYRGSVGANAGERAPHVAPPVAAHVREKRPQVAKHCFIVRGAPVRRRRVGCSGRTKRVRGAEASAVRAAGTNRSEWRRWG